MISTVCLIFQMRANAALPIFVGGGGWKRWSSGKRWATHHTPHTTHTRNTTHNTQHTRHNSQQKQRRTNNGQQATSNNQQPTNQQRFRRVCFSFVVVVVVRTLTVGLLMAERTTAGSARRRRERQFRSWVRHERMTVRAELAALLHRSRDVRPVTTDTASQGQKLASSETEAELFQLYEDEPGGRRTDHLAGVKPQERVPPAAHLGADHRPVPLCSGALARSWALPATFIFVRVPLAMSQRGIQAGCVSHSPRDNVEGCTQFLRRECHSWAVRLDTGSWQ